MRYIGGKSRIASWIVSNLKTLDNQNIVEPFCGGLSITEKLNPIFASDRCESLIYLYKALQTDWVPPSNLSENEYKAIRAKGDQTDPLYAFAAFGCSFGGKFWGGYAREGKRNFALNAKNSLLSKILNCKNVDFRFGGYKEQEYPEQSLIYCDIPYLNTTKGYQHQFNHWDFYRWCEEMRERKYTIVISEFTQPKGSKILNRKTSVSDLRTTKRTQQTVESLFIYN